MSKEKENIARTVQPAQNWSYQAEVDELGRTFDLLKDQVMILDRNAIVRYVNSAMCKKTGYVKDECLDKSPRDLWGGNMPKDFYGELWFTVKQEKRHFVGEIINKRKDGSQYLEEIHISPVADEGGEAKYFIGMAFDISNRKSADCYKSAHVVDEKENSVD